MIGADRVCRSGKKSFSPLRHLKLPATRQPSMKGKHKLAQNLKSTHSFARLSTLLVALICSGLMSCDRLGYKPATVVDDSILFDGIALASTMNHKKVYLRWEASSDPRVTMYQVYGGTSIENIIGTTTASKTEMIVPNLANGFTGVYMVQACTSPDVCSATTRALSASTLNHTVPDFNGLSSATVPTGAFGLSTVELNWDNAQGDVTGYQVFQGLGSMQTSLVDYSSPLQTDDTQSSLAWGHYIPASGATNSTTIKGLTPGTEYSFVVRAFYANGSQVLREVNSIARSATTAAIGSVPAGNPTIANLDPSFDLPSGGKQIAILGSNFMPDAVISIGSSACINQVYNGPSEILCTIPAGSAGSETVSYLSTVNGGTTYGGYFYYTSLPAPEVANISPNVSALNGGTTIQIAGSHFTTGANILIGGMPCVGTPTYVSPQLYTCITPPLPAGSHDVRVVNSDTQEVTRLAGVRYMGTPTVTDVSKCQLFCLG